MKPVPRWRTVVEMRTRALLDALPRAVRGETDAVHDARVASRRLREALALLAAARPDVRPRKLKRRVRRVTRVLGRVREFDVASALLDDIGAAHPQTSGEVQRAKGMLADARRNRADRLSRLEGSFPHKLEQGLRSMLDEIGQSEDLNWQPIVAAQIARRRRRLLRAMDGAHLVYAPEQLHLVRISVKRLRYSAELAAELTGTPAKRVLSALRGAQDVLGRMHDLQVLADHLREHDEDSSFVRTLEVIERDSRTLHADYLAHRDQLRHAAAECQHLFCLRALPRPRPARTELRARAKPRSA